MKLRRLLIILAGVAALAVASGILLWLSIPKQLPDRKVLEAMADRVDLLVKDVHYTEVGDADTKWEVRADTARYRKKENLALFEKIQVRLVMNDGSDYVLRGEKGLLHMETKDIEISGKVSIVSSQGDRFSTDVLRYRNAEGRFSTDAPIRMENSRMDVRGVGLTFSMRSKELALLSQVRATIRTF